MTENADNDFDLLRAILPSDDDLQIRSSGDYNQILIKIHPTIQIKCFAPISNSSLIIGNLHDLNIYQISSIGERWVNIREYFNQLIQQATSDTSLYSIIESMQEELAKPIDPSNTTTAAIQSTDDANVSMTKFRGADLIFNRIAHDPAIDRSKVLIGYEDRFTGIHEVPFQEFKKVHEDQYGIPMHRIRYYKINQQIVWDRIKRYDIITGSDINYSTMKNSSVDLTEGMYQYNRSIHQWTISPTGLSSMSDDQQISAKNRIYLPEQCRFLTWNILSSNHPSALLHPNERYREILKTLQSFLPDIICLQEVTQTFLDLLFDENWLKSEHYSIILTDNVLHSHGQVMLMKNIQPCAFEISKFNGSNSGCIIARFGIQSNVTIDLVNLHFDRSNDQRSEIFENFLKKMKKRNYMLIGDFNFGDDDLIEESLLEKSKYQIHDLWKEFYDLDENPGYTIDRIRNTCAQITTDISASLRADRYLLHKLSNLTYSIKHLNMAGLETIFVDEKYINQSNHYALLLKIHFQTRRLSHQSILAILPSGEVASNDSQELKYIRLYCPFFESITTEDDEENILLPLRLCLAQYQPFDIELNTSIDDPTGMVKLNEQSGKLIRQLIEQIQQLFPQCALDNNKLSIISNQAMRFTVRSLYILHQSMERCHITHHLPLGAVLEPIGYHRSDYISDELGEYFQQRNLYHDDKFFVQKQEKFNRLSHCFQGIFHSDAVHCFTHAFFPYGSFRLGVHGDDLDTVFVLYQEKSTINRTELDQKLLQLKYDRLALNAHLLDLLQRQILHDFSAELSDCRKIDALYPIISIIFTDQTRVEIFVQSIFNDQNDDERNLLANFYQPLHGVHDIERLITYTRFPVVFQHLLTFIRTWAQNVGLYGQVYGYLGGFSWAILCAYICRQNLPSTLEIFSLEQFFQLVEKFFSTYTNFNWTRDTISLYPHHRSGDTRGTMQILCPSPPYDNSSRSTTNSTKFLILEGFRQAHDEKDDAILELSNRFPHSTIQSVLQLTLAGQTINELNQWLGYMKSRLAHFLTDCEENCQLFVQTDHRIECRDKPFERFYSLGFQVNEQIVSCNRDFYYALNKFLDQFKSCPWRTETMKLSYKLISIKQWYNERLKS